MNILCVDTTTKTASVAVSKNNIVTSDSISNEITHSEKLLPLIDTTLNKANLKLSDIDMYACLNGPGSFTGIRIGIATLKAFAQVYEKNIFSISSLETLALKAYTNFSKNTCYVASLIDAKNDRVYFGIYKITKENDKVISNELIQISNELIDDALNIIHSYFTSNGINDYYICGDSINKFIDKILDRMNTSKDSLLETYPTPNDVIDYMSLLNNTDSYTDSAFTIDAIYARMSQAERMQNENK